MTLQGNHVTLGIRGMLQRSSGVGGYRSIFRFLESTGINMIVYASLCHAPNQKVAAMRYTAVCQLPLNNKGRGGLVYPQFFASFRFQPFET